MNDSARIEYKAGIGYNPNERCVWIIRFPDAFNVRFELETSGLTLTDNDKVTVSTLMRGNEEVIFVHQDM